MGAAYQPLHHHGQNQKPSSSPGSTSSGYFLPRTACTWLACAFLSLALLHLLCCSPPGPQQTFFTPLLQYVNETYSYLSSGVGGGGGQSCDYSVGEWVWSPGHARRYNGTECNVKPGQDCIRNGRPDTGYLDWRWQPAGCGLPAFDAAAFLAAVRGKHVAFVGDSMARNQAESLVCLLGAAFPYSLVYRDPNPWTRQLLWRWSFPTHNVTVSVYWAPFLARGTGQMVNFSMPDNVVDLGAPDDRWAADADTMDVVVLTASHWFWKPAVYRNGSEVIGAYLHPELNRTDVGVLSPLREAFRLALRRLSSGRARTVVPVTFAPPHFGGKRLNDPIACAKKEPYKEGEMEPNSIDKEVRGIAVEETEAAAAAARNGGAAGVRFEVLDVTKLAVMRPDGHPGPYMNRDPFAHGVPERAQTDCLHFCLPGPVDTFNEILLQILAKRR